MNATDLTGHGADFEEFANSVILGNDQIQDAKESWKDQSDIILRSFDANWNYSEKLDAMVSQKRLADESAIISSEFPNFDFVKSSLIYDAQLFIIYAEPENEVTYRGFDFFSSEWRYIEVLLDGDKGSARDFRKDYAQALVVNLFNNRNGFSITEAGRSELSNVLSFYLQKTEETNFSEERLENASKAAKDLTTALERFQLIAKHFKPEAVNELLAKHFQSIATTYSIPGLWQPYAVARLAEARSMAKQHMRTLPGGLQHALGSATSEQKLGLQYLLSRFYGDSQLVSKSFNQFQRAFLTFRKMHRRGMRSNLLGKGHHDNLHALHEIHVANRALDHVGWDGQFFYLTLNTELVAFLRGFRPGAVAVRTLHPRLAFFLQDKELHTNIRDKLKGFAAMAAGIEHTATHIDKRYTDGDIGTIDERFVPYVSALQAMHAATMDEAARSGNVDPNRNDNVAVNDLAALRLKTYFEKVIEFCGKEPTENLSPKDLRKCLSEAQAAIASLEGFSKLSRDASSIVLEEGQVAPHISEHEQLHLIMEPLLALDNSARSNHPSGKLSDEMMLVRFYANGEGGSTRVSCLPLSGNFRYLFAVHNTSVLVRLQEALNAERNAPLLVPVSHFFKILDEICDVLIADEGQSPIVRGKAQALKFFSAAFHTASMGNWALSKELVDRVVEIASDLLGNGAGQTPQARNALLMLLHEAHFVKHLALRAIAQNAPFFKGRREMLFSAMEELKKAANCMQQCGLDEFKNELTGLAPLSLRLALAQVGLISEVLALRLQFGGRKIGRMTLLPQGVEFLGFDWNANDFPKEIDFETIHVESGEDDLILRALKNLFVKYDSALKKLNTDNEYGDSFVIWGHLLMRIADIHDLHILVGKYIELENGNFSRKRLAHDTHKDSIYYSNNYFTRSLKRAGNASGINLSKQMRANPFSQAIQAYAEFLRVSEKQSENNYLRNLQGLLQHFNRLDDSCLGLSSHGLPRFLIRKAKAECAHLLLKGMVDGEDFLNREYIDPFSDI